MLIAHHMPDQLLTLWSQHLEASSNRKGGKDTFRVEMPSWPAESLPLLPTWLSSA